MIEYKVVELSVVTDESIEEALNSWTANGWHFDTIQFVEVVMPIDEAIAAGPRHLSTPLRAV